MSFTGGYSPEASEKPLHDYQNFAVSWVLDRLYGQGEKGAGVFLDPGLGKTRITLTVSDMLFKLGEIDKALVVAPLRPCYSVWPNEIRRWGFPQSSVILHNQHAKALAYDLDIEIINFAGLNRIRDIRNRWGLLVVDESTFAKNWAAKRSKYLRKLCKTIPRRLILTGTPAANSLGDLHAQMHIVDDGEALGVNVTRFRERFCVQGGWRGRKWAVRESVQQDLQDAIKDKVLYMKAEDYLDMPELVQNDIWVNMPEIASKQYSRLKRELFAELESGDVFAASAAAAYIKCRQFANGQVYSQLDDGEQETHVAHTEKIKALFELHEELAGKPLLVFYSFKHDLAQIQSVAGSPFKKCPVIGGGMKMADVDKTIDQWNAGEHHAILCQWQAVSHGLNMQSGPCSDLACVGIVDSPDTYQQAYRRVYRQGVKAKQVRVHRILTRGTVDEVMLERLEGKHETESEFLKALKRHAQEAS